MINQQLAELSNLSIVVAISLYVVALIAFAIDLARISERRGDERLRKREHERELATVGATTPGSTTASSVAAVDGDAGDAAAGDAAATARADQLPDTPSNGGHGEDDSAAGMTPRQFAFIITGAACALHVLGVALRGVATQRPPWANMYEFAMSGSALMTLAFLVLAIRRKDLRELGLFVTLPVLVLMLLAQTFWIVPAAELTPSLQNSHWLVIHILVAVAATALSGLGAVVAGLQLVQARYERAVLNAHAGVATDTNTAADGTVDAAAEPHAEPATQPWGRFGAIMQRLPSSRTLESLSFQIHAIGFVCWSFTLIFGAIWAREAWGRFWGWDPKEVWTFIIWILYAAYLHARNTATFRGSRAAWIALLGFVAVVFNYTIVNTLINGLHSYSGL